MANKTPKKGILIDARDIIRYCSSIDDTRYPCLHDVLRLALDLCSHDHLKELTLNESDLSYDEISSYIEYYDRYLKISNKYLNSDIIKKEFTPYEVNLINYCRSLSHEEASFISVGTPKYIMKGEATLYSWSIENIKKLISNC